MKTLHSTVLWCGHIVFVTWLVACSTQPADHRSDRKRDMDMQLEQSSRRADGISYQQMSRALSYYEGRDDRAGQWQANVSLAGWHIAQGGQAEAIPYARRALRLAEKLDDRSKLFASSIQLGQLTGDQTLYRQAYDDAQTALQRAIALTFLSQYDDVEKLLAGIGSDQDPDELGFLYYRYGKNRQTLQYVLLALDNYRKADNVNGVIDSLFLAAQLAQDDVAAADYAERALVAADSVGNKKRSDTIQAWMRLRTGE